MDERAPSGRPTLHARDRGPPKTQGELAAKEILFDDNSLMPVPRGLTSFVSAETPQQQILLAATAISVVPIIVFYLLAQKHILKGIGAGAIK